jgi:acetoin utilization deacetylase AcuC-like enzyme
MKPLAVVDDPLFDQHQPIGPHPERPERLGAARSAVKRARAVASIEALVARDATNEELARVHTGDYIEEIGRAAGQRGYLDADTYVSPGSVAAARRAAGAAVELVTALTDGRHDLGVALVRPPGHHARPASAMGFCLINNVAVAAAAARAGGMERVLIVDWDVHHGNGTQEMFYADPSVLYVSVHQSPFYPGTGARDETGAGEGRGYTVNVPLSAGAGDAAYAAVFERIVAPIATEFDPDLVLVSAGFDAHVRDPLASMCVSSSGFARLAVELMRALPRAAPRLGLVLEGGYDLDSLEESLNATLEALWRHEQPETSASALPPLDPNHDAEVALAQRALRQYWKLG